MKTMFEHKPQIEKQIHAILDEVKKEYEKHFWADEVIEQIKKLATSGKLVRGCLIVHNAKLLGRKPDKKMYKAAAALEIYHTGILIHDDVMDQDNYRRGQKTIHKYIEDKYGDKKFGESIAITTGDMLFFVSTHITSEIVSESTLKTIGAVSKDFIATCFAQMDDVYFPLTQEVPVNRILDMYKYKTARYTFSLPFKMSCIAAKKPSQELEEIGEILGMIFQLKDDEIGLIGKDTGKSDYNDIVQNKKTLHRHIAYQELGDQLDKYFGKNISEQEAKEVKQLMKEAKVFEKVQDIMNEKAHEAKQKIEKANLGEDHKDFLKNILRYNLTRQK